MSEPRKKTVSIRLDHAVFLNACDLAEAEDRSFNNWVNRLIEYAITRARVNAARTTELVPGWDYALSDEDKPSSQLPPSVEHPKEPRIRAGEGKVYVWTGDEMRFIGTTKPDPSVIHDPDEWAMPPDMPDPVAKVRPVKSEPTMERYPVRPAKTEATPRPKKDKK